MNVKVIPNDAEISNFVSVVQKNKNPGPYFSFCEYNIDKNIIVVSVPSCLSGVSYQVDEKIWKEYVSVFVEVVKIAISINQNGIVIPELGKSLLWKNFLVAKAARESLTNLLELCPDNFTIIFSVDKDSYEMWDKTMVF